MTRAEPDDFVRPPVDGLARLILQYARDDISLVRRTRGPAKAIATVAAQSPAPRQQVSVPLTLRSGTDAAHKRYLEDLVSLAVASAEHADDALLKATATHARAVQAVRAFACMAAVGAAVGVYGMIGFPGGRATSPNPIEIASQGQSLEQPQQRASHQLSAVQSEVADHDKAATTIQRETQSVQSDVPSPPAATRQRVIHVPGGQPIIATPLSPLHEATYTAPWPERVETGAPAPYPATWPASSETTQAASYPSLWPARAGAEQPAYAAQRRRVQVPQFLVAIQQNLRMLFR